MKTKLLIGIFLLCVSQAFAQGTWDRTTAAWSYDFTGQQADPLPALRTEENFKITADTIKSEKRVPAMGSTVSETVGGTNAVKGWLPMPTNATAFLRSSSAYDMHHIIKGTGNNKSMNMNIMEGGANKLTFLNIVPATPVAKYSFKMKLEAEVDSHTVGILRIVFGNSTGGAGVFTSSSNTNVTISTSGNIFAGFQWLYTTNTADTTKPYNDLGKLMFQFREKLTTGTSAKWVNIPDNSFVFEKNGEYDMEFYCNNYASDQTYTIGSTQYTVPSKAVHVWANGSRVGGDIYPNTSTEELAVGQSLNVFMFNQNGLAPINTANFEVSNIAASYITQTALPITLSSFTAKKVNDAVNLNWSTSSESNNSHFDIMRSANGSDFNVLGNIKGAGNSNKTENYLYTDYSPVIGTNYYKLRQVDNDAAYTDSDVRAVTIGLKEDGLWVFTDVSGSLYALINSEATAANGNLRISDISGRVVHEQTVKLEGSTKINLPVSLPGIYVASFISGGKVYSTKFVK